MKIHYNVLFLIFCMLILSCRKTEVPRTPLSYAKQMEGKHKWVGTWDYFSTAWVDDTVFDAFVFVIKDSTVLFDKLIRPNGHFLEYKGTDDVNAYIFYTYNEIINFTNPVRSISDTLKYYYQKNKITFISYDDGRISARILNVHTP